MKILFSMTYYRPYVSGLIVYVENLTEELTRRGHQVTILTSRHDPTVPAEELLGGVRIVRLPVVARISKGVLMPRFPAVAHELVACHDVVLVQVPQFEAPLLTLLGRLCGVPVVLTYLCDIRLPPGAWNRFVNMVIHANTAAAARMSGRIVALTDDYARHSPVMRRFSSKVTVIPPPVKMPLASPEAVESFRFRHGLGGHRVIGFCGRVSAEKGLETLLDAVPALLRHHPNLRIVHAGVREGVIGESAYGEIIRRRLELLRDRWISLGYLEPEQQAAFYAACDVTVLPSVNRMESFGLVQVESMLCGTPVVASELPGVRVPTRVTGMGMTVRPGDPVALAGALLEVLRDPQRFRVPRERVEAEYSVKRTADGYEALFAGL